MEFIDQLGNHITLKSPPKRIISLVPSQTELLYHLGLGDRVVGITKFCIYPELWFRTKQRVGGPKKLDFTAIKELSPDLIIGNKEENVKEEIEKLQENYPVWLSDVSNFDEALSMIQGISEVCGKFSEGEAIINQIKSNFKQLKPLDSHPSVIYMIWKKPYMAVGNGTFIHHLLTEWLGMKNVISDIPRYPVVDLTKYKDVDYVFLSTEPYPFKEKHIEEFREFFPNSQILVVDGEPFTWYGSRLIITPEYFESLKTKMKINR